MPWLHNMAASQEEDRDEQTDTEGETTEEEDEPEMEEKFSEVRAGAEWGCCSLEVPQPAKGWEAEAQGHGTWGQHLSPHPRCPANKVLACPRLS